MSHYSVQVLISISISHRLLFYRNSQYVGFIRGPCGVLGGSRQRLLYWRSRECVPRYGTEAPRTKADIPTSLHHHHQHQGTVCEFFKELYFNIFLLFWADKENHSYFEKRLKSCYYKLYFSNTRSNDNLRTFVQLKT